MIEYILIAIVYIFAGLGYYRTCKERLDSLKVKSWEYFLISIAIIFGWLLWLPIFGFAYTATEIEFFLKKNIL